jgi:hypothetical protein
LEPLSNSLLFYDKYCGDLMEKYISLWKTYSGPLEGAGDLLTVGIDERIEVRHNDGKMIETEQCTGTVYNCMFNVLYLYNTIFD